MKINKLTKINTRYDMIHKLRRLPWNGLVSDFSGIGLNEFVEFSDTDFTDMGAFELQLDHIKNRAEELNASLQVRFMPNVITSNYLLWFETI